MLPSDVKNHLPQGGLVQGFLFLYSAKSFRQKLKRYWVADPAHQGNSSNCLLLIMNRQMGNNLIHTKKSYSVPAQHISKTLYKAMCGTDHKVPYLLRPGWLTAQNSGSNLY